MVLKSEFMIGCILYNYNCFVQNINKTLPSFSVVKSQIDDLLEYLRNSGEENDFLRDNFEIMFRDSLQENSNDIAEEIKFYCSQ